MQPLWVILVFLALVMYGAGTAAARERELLSRERLAAIDKGLLLPYGLDHFPEARKRASNALGLGLFWLGGGIGLTVTLAIVFPEKPQWGWGLSLIAVGVAQLVYWFAWGKKEWEEARELDRDLRLAWIQRQGSETSLPAHPPGA